MCKVGAFATSSDLAVLFDDDMPPVAMPMSVGRGDGAIVSDDVAAITADDKFYFCMTNAIDNSLRFLDTWSLLVGVAACTPVLSVGSLWSDRGGLVPYCSLVTLLDCFLVSCVILCWWEARRCRRSWRLVESYILLRRV